MKKNSVLAKNLKMIFLVLGVITAIAGLLFVGAWLKYASNDISKMRMREAEAVANSVDISLQSASSLLLSLTENEAVIASVIVPENEENLLRAVKSLQDIAEVNYQVEELFLIPVGAGVVCSSKEGVMSEEAFRYSEISSAFQARGVRYTVGAENWTEVITKTGKIFLICGFYYSEEGKVLGLLGARISPNAFNDVRFLMVDTNAAVLICDRNGEVIYSRNTSLMKNRKHVSEITYAGGFGLTYTYQYVESVLNRQNRFVFAIILLAILINIVIDFLLARKIAYSMYAPLRTTIEHIFREQPEIKTETLSDNEYDFIHQVYEENRASYHEASEVLALYMPKILETLCRRIIDGSVETAEIEKTLKSSGSIWSAIGNYTIQEFRYFKLTGEQIEGLDHEVVLQELQQAMKRGLNQGTYVLFGYENRYLLVRFSQKQLTHKQAQVLENQVTAITAQTAAHYQCRVYTSVTVEIDEIMRLPEAAEMAKSNLNQMIESLVVQEKAKEKSAKEEAEETGETNETDETGSGNAVFLKMKHFIHSHYSDGDLSLTMIADYMQMNSSYLSSLFVQEQKENFTDYLNRYRIRRAKQLLDTTDILVRDVGYSVGFGSAQNFNRVFKRYMGMTPGQYKKAQGG